MAVANETIIAALLEQGTVKEAAVVAGVSPRTIYDRMKDKGFKAEYKLAKADITRQAVHNINSKIAGAINAVSDIMNDRQVNAAIRLQAAQTLLTNAVKFAERLQADELTADKETTSPFDIF